MPFPRKPTPFQTKWETYLVESSLPFSTSESDPATEPLSTGDPERDREPDRDFFDPPGLECRDPAADFGEPDRDRVFLDPPGLECIDPVLQRKLRQFYSNLTLPTLNLNNLT